MHMFSKEKNFYGGHGIVGAQVVARHRARLRQPLPRGRPRLASPISATAPPTRARSTRASTWPSCGSCRSSTSSRTTATPWAPRSRRASAQTDFSKRGVSFNIPGEQVDGMDVRAVRDAGSRAIEHCRVGQGPVHPRDADLPLPRPLHVRPGEVPHQGRGHPHARGARPDRAGPPPRSSSSGRSSEDELKKIDGKVREIVNEAAEFATHDPEPDVSELWTDILLEARA